MDLSTTWMGIPLAHPLMPGASPLVDDLDMVRRLEDSGAAAIVMHSLFEEQVVSEQLGSFRNSEVHAESSAEALSYFVDTNVFALGPDEYLNQLRKIRDAVNIPVIGSLNGVSEGGWMDYACWMEQAGAHGLELNLYALAADVDRSAAELEADAIQIVRHLKSEISIPLAVKLSPFYSALPHFAQQLKLAGADGLILFNRFYQPDIDPENLALASHLHLSNSDELLLRLRWLGILSGRVPISLACSGGVHTPQDALKAILAGANGVQLTSALLRHGPEHLRGVLEGLKQWLVEHEYESIAQACGSMNLMRCPDPGAYERSNYVRMLQSWAHR